MVMIFAFLRLPTLFILLKNAERKSIFSANQIKPYYFLMGHNILWHYQRFTISHWIFSASTRIGFSCHHFWTCFTFVITVLHSCIISCTTDICSCSFCICPYKNDSIIVNSKSILYIRISYISLSIKYDPSGCWYLFFV